MNAHPTLLFELGTEELPPKALPALRDALCAETLRRLQAAGLTPTGVQALATPRRLALLLDGLPAQQPEQSLERRGPAVAAAFTADGQPTRAAEGFARSCGVSVRELIEEDSDKGRYLVYREQRPGATLAELLPAILQAALAALPTPKRMRWGSGSIEFVRPVHWLVVLYGEHVLDLELLGLRSDRITYGHRFHCPQPLSLAQASDYVERLRTEGKVEVDFDRRRAHIAAQIQQHAQAAEGQALVDPDLLDEVTALVEWPVALTGAFAARFLEVPQEALISTMQDNQKYFPLVDTHGQMLPRFIVISNLESSNPDAVRTGNERVLRPRFADAEFFWEQDRQHSLDSRQPWLESVVFEQRLGTLAAKVRRLEYLMGVLSEALDMDPTLAQRAARLCKCDLGTRMVFEFPELQGTMGRYYARHDGEAAELAQAMEQHYWPRQSGGPLPEGDLAAALALADRLDTLVGIFAIGKEPSGTKDPFALRRAALGLLRILIEQQRPLALTPLLSAAARGLAEAVPSAPDAVSRVYAYIQERLRGYLLEQGIAPEVFEAVAAIQPDQPWDFFRRTQAVQQFQQRPEAAALAAANKRIQNLLRKSTAAHEIEVNRGLLLEPAEQALHHALESLEPTVVAALEHGDYVATLTALAALREPIDAFFTEVMVMAEDAALRGNRLALLRRLAQRFEAVADISRLATG